MLFGILSILLCSIVLVPLCDSFLGLTYQYPRSIFHSAQSLSRRIDESLAFLSFGLRSSMSPIPFSSPGFPLVEAKTAQTEKKSIVEKNIPVGNHKYQEPIFPWTQSITPSRNLAYMPMFLDQLKVVKRLNMKEVELPASHLAQESSQKPARIRNLCFENEHFRKVRMTYFDAGDNVQVFNTLWYPHYQYDLPLLGVDLISLGKSRVLTVVDFQPLYPTKEYFDKFIAHLSPIREKYADLQGTLSGKIYNDTSFFSANMLFGRFTDESKLEAVVRPAFQEYLSQYLQLIEQAKPNFNERAMKSVQERQAAYDVYSALKDPAVGLFNTYFGKEWSDDFVHNFLFSLSRDSQKMQESSLLFQNDTDQPVHSFQFDATGTIQPISGKNSH